jgi:superoxide dismutase
VQICYQEHASSARVLFHYGKHHKAYVDNLNILVAGTDFENTSLEEVILTAQGDPVHTGRTYLHITMASVRMDH